MRLIKITCYNPHPIDYYFNPQNIIAVSLGVNNRMILHFNDSLKIQSDIFVSDIDSALVGWGLEVVGFNVYKNRMKSKQGEKE